jgi:hypothetical protein
MRKQLGCGLGTQSFGDFTGAGESISAMVTPVAASEC